MARIPLQIAQQRLDTGPVVDYGGVARSPVGQAMEGLGTAVSRVGEREFAAIERRQAMRQELEGFEAQQRFTQFKIAAQGDAEGLAQTVGPSGAGYHDGALQSFDTRAAEFLETVPQGLRPKFDALLQTERDQFGQIAGRAELEQRQTWYRTGLEQAVGRGQEQVYNNPDALDAARQEAIREIDASGLSAIEKDEWRTKVEQGLATSLAARVMQDDPASLIDNLGVAAPGFGDPNLPAGMRNNNPGNIKFVGQGRDRGVIGPSVNTDQGDPQAVFATPEDGMREAYRLARAKYDGGKTTANELIAGQGGWTPGNRQAAANIAATMNLGPDDDLNLQDPQSAAAFLRALVRQEHGPASDQYSNELIQAAVGAGPRSQAPQAAARQPGPSQLLGRDGKPANMEGMQPVVADRVSALQAQWGRPLPINSAYRDPSHNARVGGARQSQHTHGNAVDIDVSRYSEDERKELIAMASAMGFTGVGVYNTAIHLDMGDRRAWGPSHKGDSVPEWARETVEAHLAGRANSSSPGRRLDPRFAALPFAERLRIASDAQTAFQARQRATQTRLDADYKLYKDRIELSALTGGITNEDQILFDPMLNDADRSSLLRTYRSQQREVSEIDRAVRDYLSGGLTDLNALDADQRKTANGVYDTLMKSAEGAQPDALQALSNDFIQRTGIIPDPVAATVRRAPYIDNPQDLSSALDEAGRLQTISPIAFDTMPNGEQLRRDLTSYQSMVNDRGMSSADAAKRIIERRTPEARRNEEILGPQADKIVRDLEVSDVTRDFATGWLGFGQPGEGVDPTTSNALLAEYRESFREEFIRSGGDETEAKAQALRILRQTWGESQVSGDRQLMKYPPEQFYPAVDGGHVYLRDDAVDAAMDFAGEGAAMVENIMLRPDAATAADIRAGRAPRYRLFYQFQRDGQTIVDEVPGYWAMPDAAGRSAAHRTGNMEAAQDKRGLMETAQDALDERAAAFSAYQTGQPVPTPTAPPVEMPAMPADPRTAAGINERLQTQRDELFRNADR